MELVAQLGSSLSSNFALKYLGVECARWGWGPPRNQTEWTQPPPPQFTWAPTELRPS